MVKTINMDKSQYKFLIFFLALGAACGLLENIITFKLGEGIYQLEAIATWIIGVGIISFIGSVSLLKYFHYRKYWFAFSAAIVSLITNICYLIVLCSILISRQLNGYYKISIIINLCAGVVFAISLIASGNRKNIWLKIAGAYAFVISIILLGTAILNASIKPDTLARIVEWSLLAALLVPVMLIMHLRMELRSLNAEQEDISIPEYETPRLTIIKAIACIVAIALASVIGYQCAMQVYWGKRNFESTQKLARLFEARVFVNSKGDSLRYRLLKPLNYEPKKRYPLVISLPYGGQPATDTIKQIDGAQAAQVLSTDANRKKYPAFIFVPNCPAGSGWGGIKNYPTVDTLVYKAITALDTAFSIDAKRRYVTGVSRGGYGTWHFICTRPDLFAAAIPICGGDDPKLASKIVNVSVWAFHGAKDQNVPVSNSRNMIEGMKKAGLKPLYTEYPNQGHNIWYQVSTTPGLWDWLFAQKRY